MGGIYHWCNVTPYFDNLFTSHCIINIVFYVSTVNTSSLLTETPNFTYSRPTSFYCGEGVMRRERERGGGTYDATKFTFCLVHHFPELSLVKPHFQAKNIPEKIETLSMFSHSVSEILIQCVNYLYNLNSMRYLHHAVYGSIYFDTDV